MPALAGVLENKAQMKRRIKMIVQFKNTSKSVTIMAVALIVLLAGVFLTNANESSQMNAPSSKKSVLVGEEQIVIAAARTWLELVDNERYEESWLQAADYFKNAVSKEQWQRSMMAVRKALGARLSRELITSRYETTLPGAPSGKYYVLEFKTSFDMKQAAIETVTPMFDNDGKWRVSGYYIK